MRPQISDIILNSDYRLKKEIEGVVAAIDLSEVNKRCDATTRSKLAAGKKGPQGKQSTINAMFRAEFDDRGWESEKKVFGDPGNDDSSGAAVHGHCWSQHRSGKRD
jgi:hypothetical protein